MKKVHLATLAITLLCPICLLGQAPSASAPSSAPGAGCPNFTSIDEFGVLPRDVCVGQGAGRTERGRGLIVRKNRPRRSCSTSLVDQSSATDFVSIAASLIPVGPTLGQSGASQSSGQSGTGSGTATASIYALLAGFNHIGPTDPRFYREHVNSRRITFTIGTATSTQAENNSTTPATVYGAKLLLINSRELYTTGNLNRIRVVQTRRA